jgi:hypothetical protein
LCTIGGGLAWGAMILDWSTTGVAPAPRTLASAPAGG